MTKQRIKATEEWLDEREVIMAFGDKADEAYYKGAIEAIQWLGFYVKYEKGKHKLIK